MFVHPGDENFVHIVDEMSSVTRCNKKASPDWHTFDGQLAPGAGLPNCPACGTAQEFDAHLRHLHTIEERRQRAVALAEASRSDETAAAKADIARDLGERIARALFSLGLHVQALPTGAGSRVVGTYKKNGHVFRFSFDLF